MKEEKKHYILDICRYKGTMKLEYCKDVGFINLASYCIKQQECPDKIHKEMLCDICPDYQPYEYTMETTTNKNSPKLKTNLEVENP